ITVISSETELEDALTRPHPALVESIRSISSPLVILGAGGKMGPSMAVLARRAADTAGHRLRIVAVSRFSDKQARACLEKAGVETCEADLLEREAFKGLPDSNNVIYLVGLKFGT